MIFNKIIYILLVAVLLFFYVMYIDNLSLFLLVSAVILPFVLIMIALHTRSRLEAQLISSRMSENKKKDITIDVKITNKSIFPVSNACIYLEIMNSADSIPEPMTATVPVQALNSQIMSFNISSEYCGKLIVKLRHIKIYDYIKLFSFRKKFDISKEIVIMPDTYPIAVFTDHLFDENTQSELYSKFKSGDDCSEVFDIRNYNEGDKINRIHWKLSMKQETLMVKEYSLPVNCSVLVLFEFSTDFKKGYMLKLDTLMETLASVSESIAESEAVHEISWYNTIKENYVSSRISVAEDVASFLGTLLRSKAYTEPNKAYFQHIKADAGNRYSHMIYITSSVTKEILDNIISDENIDRKTIIYITENIDILPEFLIKADDMITLIPVQCGKISQCLYEMVV